MTGKKYGRLTVIEMLYGYKTKKNNKPRTYVKCRCDCGNIVIRNAFDMRKPGIHSCGCAKKEVIQSWKSTDITGQKFGRLTVLKVLWENTPIKVLCECDCGTIKIYNKNDVISGHTKSCGCYMRDRTSETNTKDFTNYIAPNGVKFLKQYKKNDKNQWLWECVCPFCGSTFVALPAKILNQHVNSCGCLNTSWGEKYVEKILKKINCNYKKQYTFKDLVSNKNYKLRFDFAIFDKENNLKCLIEYDGQQHYYPVECYGGQKGYQETIERDNLKNNYCKDNNINLIRIPYWLRAEEIEKNLTNI